jgi:ribosome biogenesis GTPase / thiamine phosphate phosphatase
MNTINTYDQGVVVKKNIGSYHVRTNGAVIQCALSTRLRKEFVFTSENSNSAHRAVKSVKELDKVDPIAIGDLVRFTDGADGFGMIVEVLPRRNRLARQDPAPGTHKFEQVIVANVDYVIPVFAAANPTPKWGLLDRYLISAESLDLSALIVITKMDLVRDAHGLADEEIEKVIEEYRRIGYPVVTTSSISGEGLETLRGMLKGNLSAFVGKSGVGKTALLNALEPGLALRVGAVGDGKMRKGRHTTTSPEMVPLGSGGHIIDTPGVREFGLSSVDEADLAIFFPEMRLLLGQCKFGVGCRHDEEPGCAIRKAVVAGKISPQRYQSYLVFKKDLER